MLRRPGKRRPILLLLLLPLLALPACGGSGPALIDDVPLPDASLPTGAPDAGAAGSDAGARSDATVPPPPDSGSASDASALPDTGAGPIRAIPPGVLARKAIAYSGYRTGQSPETQTYPSDAEVKADLEILIQGGWTFLRLYDCSPFAESVPPVTETV